MSKITFKPGEAKFTDTLIDQVVNAHNTLAPPAQSTATGSVGINGLVRGLARDVLARLSRHASAIGEQS